MFSRVVFFCFSCSTGRLPSTKLCLFLLKLILPNLMFLSQLELGLFSSIASPDCLCRQDFLFFFNAMCRQPPSMISQVFYKSVHINAISHSSSSLGKAAWTADSSGLLGRPSILKEFILWQDSSSASRGQGGAEH